MRFLTVIGSMLLTALFFVAPAMAADSSVSSALTDVLHTKGVIDDATYNDLKNAQAVGGDQALNSKLVEVLHNKGILDDASYNKLAEQAKAPVVAVAPQASPASAAPSDRPLEKAFSAVEEGFAKLGGDTVKLKIGTWTQLGYVYDNAGSNQGALPYSSAPVSNSSNQFYIRFARLYFNGTLGDKVGFRVMLDGAGTPPLRDAYAWFDYIPYTRVTLGQFLTPFGDETWRAPFELPMINYSMAAGLMQFPNFRDIGLMASSKYITKGPWPVGGGFATALINGSGMNTSDNNDTKDWIGRAWINPFVPGLSVGGSWYLGKTDVQRSSSNARVWNRFDNQRWGAELDYAPTFLKGLMVRAEYLQQRKFFNSFYEPVVTRASAAPFGITASSFNDSSKIFAATTETTATALSKTSPFRQLRPGEIKLYHSEGWYAEAAYRVNGLTGGLRFLNDFEPTFRYDYLDEDMATKNNSRNRYTFGLNYWVNKYTRILTNYESISAGDGLKSKSLVNVDNFGHQVVTTNIQIWF